VCADNRFLLSGTMFDEPTVERILGYYTLLQQPGPNNIPDMTYFITSPSFKGLGKDFITSSTAAPSLGITVTKKIIEHTISPEEASIYVTLKTTLKIIRDHLIKLKNSKDIESIKKFNSYLLTIIIYIRQCIVCPIITLANIYVSISDLQNRSILTEILHTEFQKLNLTSWLEKESSIVSTRIQKILEVVETHKNDKIVLFTCFKTSIDMIEYCLKTHKPCINISTLSSTMNVKKRASVLEEFNKPGPGILLLSYDIGACGLNLQCASVMIIADFWWNVGKTQQATARVLRRGQLSNVNLYYFTSNTGIEKALFVKQQDKILILNELMDGPIKSEIKSVNMNEIINLIEKNENINLLTSNFKL